MEKNEEPEITELQRSKRVRQPGEKGSPAVADNTEDDE